MITLPQHRQVWICASVTPRSVRGVVSRRVAYGRIESLSASRICLYPRGSQRPSREQKSGETVRPLRHRVIQQIELLDAKMQLEPTPEWIVRLHSQPGGSYDIGSSTKHKSEFQVSVGCSKRSKRHRAVRPVLCRSRQDVIHSGQRTPYIRR